MYTAVLYKTKQVMLFNNISLVYKATEHKLWTLIARNNYCYLSCLSLFNLSLLMTPTGECYNIHDPRGLGLSKINLHFLNIIFYFINQNEVIKKTANLTNCIVRQATWRLWKGLLILFLVTYWRKHMKIKGIQLNYIVHVVVLKMILNAKVAIFLCFQFF